VLTNLFINAKDAMPHGGQLRLKTGNIELRNDFKCICGNFRPGDYIVIEVVDSGIGMP